MSAELELRELFSDRCRRRRTGSRQSLQSRSQPADGAFVYNSSKVIDEEQRLRIRHTLARWSRLAPQAQHRSSRAALVEFAPVTFTILRCPVAHGGRRCSFVLRRVRSLIGPNALSRVELPVGQRTFGSSRAAQGLASRRKIGSRSRLITGTDADETVELGLAASPERPIRQMRICSLRVSLRKASTCRDDSRSENNRTPFPLLATPEGANVDERLAAPSLLSVAAWASACRRSAHVDGLLVIGGDAKPSSHSRRLRMADGDPLQYRRQRFGAAG